jgi:hypothetical protein
VALSSSTGISHRRDELDEFQLRMIEQAALTLCAHCIKLQTLVTGAAGGPVPSHLVLPEALLLATLRLSQSLRDREGSEQLCHVRPNGHPMYLMDGNNAGDVAMVAAKMEQRHTPVPVACQ